MAKIAHGWGGLGGVSRIYSETYWDLPIYSVAYRKKAMQL